MTPDKFNQLLRKNYNLEPVERSPLPEAEKQARREALSTAGETALKRYFKQTYQVQLGDSQNANVN